MSPATSYKFKSVDGKGSAWSTYRRLIYGDQSLMRILYAEFVSLLCGNLPGALGLVLRKALYPRLFAACGSKVVFGRNLVLRHTHKIHLGAGVIIDDHVVLDAKGDDNQGIRIGDGVYVGRNTIIYCKGGNIRIGDQTNVSSNCQIFSSNDLEVGHGTMMGAYTYLLSGGEYDYASDVPFAQQSGMETKGPLRIGSNCWLGARITVLDGASVGDHCVLAAGAVVTKPVPSNCLAGGIPAKVLKERLAEKDDTNKRAQL